MAEGADEVRGTPAFTTGGGGFAFEDRAGAWALSAMIAGQAPIGSLGVPSVIEFQQKVPPTALDDVVITGGADTSPPRWFASIKSFDLLGTANVLEEFAGGAWVQYLSDDFDSERDYVGFICGHARDDDWTSLLELIETVRNDSPKRMADRIAVRGLFSATDRGLWQAFRCPEELATPYGVDVETSPALLLQRLIPLRMDFRSADSGSEAEAKQWCQRALAVGHIQRAEDLYEAAFELVSRARPSGGSIDWGRVQRELGTRFPLALRPDAAPDWAVLDRHTPDRLEAVSDTLAHGLSLPRAEARRELSAAGDAPFIYLTGPSGCGKTALAKAWLTESAGGQLWLTPRDVTDGLLEFGRRLGLRLSLVDVLGLGQAPVRIVIDGLDRSYDTGAHAAAAALARLAAKSAGGIQVLVTSQAFDLERVTRLIAEANGPRPRTVVMGDLDDEDIEIALNERPDLHRLVFQGELREVLKRPKMLQVVFQALGATSDEALAEVRDEAGVADLWWDRLALGTSADRVSRNEFLRGLASWTAEKLADGLPAGELGSAGLADYVGVVDPLRSEEILAVAEDTYAFGHDLFADWTRYRSLGQWDTAQAAFGERQHLPTWHRAIRLFALRTLREEGIERWSEQHQALKDAGHEVAADLYLDAPLFASDAEAHIEVLWPALVADSGALLARMLNRFGHSASVPDPRGALITMGGDPELQTYMAATWRVPIWVLWPPVIRALAAHLEEAVRAAPIQVAAIADRWLRLTPAGYVARAEAAQLGCAIGEFLETAYENGVYLDEDQKLKMWEAFLAAAAELPDEVPTAALEALRPAGEEEVEDL